MQSIAAFLYIERVVQGRRKSRCLFEEQILSGGKDGCCLVCK
jgi:hypothetical protein